MWPSQQSSEISVSNRMWTVRMTQLGDDALFDALNSATKLKKWTRDMNTKHAFFNSFTQFYRLHQFWIVTTIYYVMDNLKCSSSLQMNRINVFHLYRKKENRKTEVFHWLPLSMSCCDEWSTIGHLNTAQANPYKAMKQPQFRVSDWKWNGNTRKMTERL